MQAQTLPYFFSFTLANHTVQTCFCSLLVVQAEIIFWEDPLKISEQANYVLHVLRCYVLLPNANNSKECVHHQSQCWTPINPTLHYSSPMNESTHCRNNFCPMKSNKDAVYDRLNIACQIYILWHRWVVLCCFIEIPNAIITFSSLVQT